jgi:hypothetical protein
MNNNVTWTASSSSYSTVFVAYPYTAFIPSSNLTPTVTGGATTGWISSSSAYNGTSGTPTGQYNAGTYSTPIQNATAANSVISVSGEWLQIQSSVPVILNNFNFVTNAFSIANSASRLPYKFYICGSNDNNTWNPIIYGAWASLPIASGVAVLTPTSTYVINGTNSLTSNTSSTNYTPVASTSPDTKLNYITYGNGSSAYTYFRVVVSSIIGSNLGSTASGTTDSTGFLWNPTFSVASQTGPSRALLYMDASNINQLDVSGSLALVNTNPSTMTVSPNTTVATSYTWQNNNITWVAFISNMLANYQHYKAFNLTYGDLNSTASVWSYASGSYVGNAGNAAVTTQTTNILSPGPGNTNGDFLQIQSSVPLVMKTYQFATGGQPSQLPKTFWIVGSNDGTAWYPIHFGSFSAQPSSTNNALIAGVVTVNASSSVVGSATLTTTTYSTTTNSYTYFRLIALTLYYTGAQGYFEVGEWLINFTPTTSSVSMALDNTTPNQLNIGGQLSIGGSLGIAGGITPLYSTPSFTSAQVGYSIVNSLSSSSTSTTRFTMSTITITPGVWILSASIAVSSGTGCQVAITTGSDLSWPYVAISYANIYYYPSLTGVAIVSSTTSYNLVYQPYSASSTTYTGPFSAVRIA